MTVFMRRKHWKHWGLEGSDSRGVTRGWSCDTLCRQFPFAHGFPVSEIRRRSNYAAKQHQIVQGKNAVCLNEQEPHDDGGAQ